MFVIISRKEVETILRAKGKLMIEFVSKDNLHTATDKDKIRRLMANAERLGENGLVEKCSQRLEQLKNSSQQNKLKMNSAVSKIDLTYWMGMNTYYGNMPFNKSMFQYLPNLLPQVFA